MEKVRKLGVVGGGGLVWVWGAYPYSGRAVE